MLKRIFDFIFSILGLFFLGLIILLFICIAAFDTNSNGFFLQQRVGQYGKLFTIYKIKSIHEINKSSSNFGLFLRKYKIDELPQLINILKGEMSFVGPRPDIEGYYDKLQGENEKILELKPGLTSEASIKYVNEEEILRLHSDFLQYNDEIIFPDKVKMNLQYYYNKSILLDIKIILKTIFRK
ncbi:sugar transferase [Flavobacterium sp. LB1P62]|uniref:sugar transferase n=1 Tax=Flavobacterium sp. LB1P62 TaxID=3401715 RepID=UPI003AAD9569